MNCIQTSSYLPSKERKKMMKDNQLTMGVEETIAADGENWS